MVESEHRLFADRLLKQAPIAVTDFIEHVHEVLIVLEREVLASELIVQGRREHQFVPRLVEMLALLLDESLPFCLLRQHLLTFQIATPHTHLVQSA